MFDRDFLLRAIDGDDLSAQLVLAGRLARGERRERNGDQQPRVSG